MEMMSLWRFDPENTSKRLENASETVRKLRPPASA